MVVAGSRFLQFLGSCYVVVSVGVNECCRYMQAQIGAVAGDARLLCLHCTHGGFVQGLIVLFFMVAPLLILASATVVCAVGLNWCRFTNGGGIVCVHCSDGGCVKVAAMVIELHKEKHVAGLRTVVEALRCIIDLGFSHGEGE